MQQGTNAIFFFLRKKNIFSDLISNTSHHMLHHFVEHSNLSGGKGKFWVYISDWEIVQIWLDSLKVPQMYSTVKDNDDYMWLV